MTRTYSLPEAAEIICGGSDPADIYWLAQRLRGNAQPALAGFKAKRKWRMTEEQVQDALRILTPEHVGVPEVPQQSSLMRRSRRKLAS